jgi:hypothetical protein
MHLSFTTPVLASILALSLLAGCQSRRHTMSQPQTGNVAVCKSCYDHITKVRQSHPRTGATTQTLHHHMCPDCNSDLSVYSEGGVLKAKCAQCAPDGVACDLCIPKTDTK